MIIAVAYAGWLVVFNTVSLLMSQHKITIVGIGDDGAPGLTQIALEVIRNAKHLLGTSSLLAKFPEYQGPSEALGADLDRLANRLESAEPGTVLLATGDPLFYGTARFLCDRLGKERFEVLPHVSSMQLAFARVKESWEEAYLTNLATQPLDHVLEKIRSAEKVGVFTSEDVPPQRLAEAMLAKGVTYFTAYICENLGSPDERVTRSNIVDVVSQRFSPLNVMVLVRHDGVPDQVAAARQRRLFGNPDELFRQSKPKRGLLTPSEVRAIALSELNLKPSSIVWDIGAGSGSVAIEAALIARSGKVYAIEMDAEDYGLLMENAKQFSVPNVVGVLGEAPAAWANLPDPDAIFIGGTGRSVTDLVASSWSHLQKGGCLIANVLSMEYVVAMQQLLSGKLRVEPTLWMIQISRGIYQLEKHSLETSNPSFLIKAVKE